MLSNYKCTECSLKVTKNSKTNDPISQDTN